MYTKMMMGYTLKREKFETDMKGSGAKPAKSIAFHCGNAVIIGFFPSEQHILLDCFLLELCRFLVKNYSLCERGHYCMCRGTKKFKFGVVVFIVFCS
jgi:hypothetical protein